jgi:hypothetical protein
VATTKGENTDQHRDPLNRLQAFSARELGAVQQGLRRWERLIEGLEVKIGE